MLNIAVRDELIPANPCASGIKIKKYNHKKKVLYTKNELLSILGCVKGTEFALPILLECCCGLRHEEFCGLNKSDFEFSPDG